MTFVGGSVAPLLGTRNQPLATNHSQLATCQRFCSGERVNLVPVLSPFRGGEMVNLVSVLPPVLPPEMVNLVPVLPPPKCLFDILWPTIRDRRPYFDFETTISGVRFSGNTKDTIPALLYYLGMVEDNLTYWFEEQLRPGDIFVDVGAHIGYFSLLEAQHVGASGGVVAIEASPHMA